MAQNNQPKHRQQGRDLRRQRASRKPIERLLIVCEGSKTEPNYLSEIRHELKLPTANVMVLPSQDGNDPLTVVNYAKKIFEYGDSHRKIRAREFDRVYAVFDRDEHLTYNEALREVSRLHLCLKNNDKYKVSFQAITSVPCFELWLLLHFEDVQTYLHRDEANRRLKKYLCDYQKGSGGHWASTKMNLEIAKARAVRLYDVDSAVEGANPYTNMYELTECLINLKNPS